MPSSTTTDDLTEKDGDDGDAISKHNTEHNSCLNHQNKNRHDQQKHIETDQTQTRSDGTKAADKINSAEEYFDGNNICTSIGVKELEIIPQPDFSYFTCKSSKHQAPNISKLVEFDTNLANGCEQAVSVLGIDVTVVITFVLHRLIQIYGQVEETVLLTGSNIWHKMFTANNIYHNMFTGDQMSDMYVTRLRHEGLESLSILNAVGHLKFMTVNFTTEDVFDETKFVTVSNTNQSGNRSGLLHFEILAFPGFVVCATSNSISADHLNQMMTTFETMLTHIVSNPFAQLSTVPYLNALQRTDLVKQWESTSTKFLTDNKTLLDLFLEMVAEYPNRIAVIYGTLKLTYEQLDQESNKIVHLCQRSLEVTDLEKVNDLGNANDIERVIALYLDKSELTFIAILATFKLGCAYVPIDPTYPAARVESILADTGAKCVLLNRKYRGFQPFKSLVKIEIESVRSENVDEFILSEILDDPIRPPITPQSLAYIIFTSGTSEGRPKGVLTEHSNVTNYVADMSFRNFGSNPQDSGEVILQLSNYVFDVAVDQMWLGLANGLTCVIPMQNMWYDPELFYSYLQKHCVTHISGTPSFLKQFNWDRVPSLRRLIFGGEKLSVDSYKRLRGAGRYDLISMFGPTECTIIAAHYAIQEYTTCVGKAMSNTAFQVLDVSMTPVPIDTVGELYISGRAVCRGYLNRPELNEKAFVKNPFGGDFDQLYRTGDLVRRHSDGTVSFIGRKDGQIKIRGNRVEIMEIKHVLLSFPQIEDGAVVAREITEGSGLVLMAYYVSAVPLVEKFIKQFLTQKLPEYMVPVRVIRVDSIPLTITGKLDVRKLPNPDFENQNFEILESELSKNETAVYKVWKEVLGTELPSIDSNFFELGGNSLSALQIVARLREHYGFLVTVHQIFEFQTIRRLSKELTKTEQGVMECENNLTLFDPELTDKVKANNQVEAIYLANSLQQGFIYKYLHSPTDGSYIVQNLWQYHEEIDVEKFKAVWLKLVLKYPCLRLRFDWEHQLIQIIGAEPQLDFRYLPNFSEPVENLLEVDRQEGYDLSKAPLFRIYLIREGPALFSCIFSNHHAIIDGISTALLLASLSDLYSNNVLNMEHIDTAYGITQRYIHSSNAASAGLDWWKAYLGQIDTRNSLVGILKQNIGILKKDKGTLKRDKGILKRDNSVLETDNSILKNDKEMLIRENDQIIKGSRVMEKDNEILEEDNRIWIRDNQNTNKDNEVQIRNERHLHLDTRTEVVSPQKLAIVIENDIVSQLRKFSAVNGFTLQSILQFAWHKVLSVYGTSKETICGLTVNGRSAPIPGIHSSVGPYVNTLPLYVNHVTNDAVTMIKKVQETIQEIVSREYVNLASLSSGEERLFDNVFVYENCEVGLPHGTAVFEKVDYPLVLVIQESKTDILIQLTFDADIFDSIKIEQFLETFKQILSQIPNNTMKLVTQAEEDEIHHQLQGPLVDFDLTLKLHHLFGARVAQTPDDVALVTENKSFTFAQLDVASNRIRNMIGHKNPANPIIPTFFDAPGLLPSAILGIFKSGGGYCPLDPNLPPERVGFILKDISAYGKNSKMVILTLSKFDSELKQILSCEPGLNIEVIDLDLAEGQSEGSGPPLLPGDIATVIYTSGTTGVPKGVVLQHSGLVNYCLEQTRSNFSTKGDLVLSVLGWAFDGFWCSLAPGIFGNCATAVVSAKTMFEPESLVAFMIRQNVTHIVGNPLHLCQLPLKSVRSLKTILSAGSTITTADANKLLKTGARLMNGFGPTETSVISTWGDVVEPSNVVASRDIVAPSNILATRDIVASSNIVASGDIVAASNILASRNKVAASHILASRDILAASNFFASREIVAASNFLASRDIVAASNIVASREKIASSNILASRDTVADSNIVASREKIAPSNIVVSRDTVAASNILASRDKVASSNIVASRYLVAPGDIHIGGPLSNTTLYILDDDLHQVPRSCIGELFIGGVGVSAGYLKQLEETEKTFIKNPFGPGKIHKSGDLVSLRGDGRLDYHGRKDFQVKVRGYRINCAEIEAVVTSFPNINYAVVSLFDKKVVGFIVSKQRIEMAKLFEFLEGKIPEYMIPTEFFQIEGIPLNANGKVDYKKLHQICFEKASTTVGTKVPCNVVEQQISTIWAEVLRIPTTAEPFGVDENFFRMGGDSISAIQIVSRLRQRYNIEIRVADIFSYKTIQKLAKFVNLQSKTEGALPQISEQGMLIGQVPLLPIQDWFFALFKDSVTICHFNQAFLLKVPPLDVASLQKCVDTLNKFHDSLRLRYSFENDKVIQNYAGAAAPPKVRCFKWSEIRDRPEIFTEVQGTFNLEAGPVWSVCYISGYEDGSARLHFSFHHLLVDTVSWRIMIGQFFDLFRGGKLERKGTSYRQWVTVMRELYSSLKEEKSYWENVITNQNAQKSNLPFKTNVFSTSRVTLDEVMTFALLNSATKAFNTTPLELILTALAYVLKSMTGEGASVVRLEGHGREDALVEGIDLSQTVGWFTTMFPFQLFLGDSIGESIISIKEALRAVPNKGIGYGFLIGYLDPPLPPITLNFLGRFDDKLEWTFTNEYAGKTYANTKAPEQAGLAIDLMVVNGQLEAELTGNLDEGYLGNFGKTLLQEINNVVCYTSQLGRSYLTTSDINFVISSAVLNHIQREREVEAVFKVTSLQEGFIFYYLSHPQPPFAYHVQHSWNYETNLEVELMRQAWRNVHSYFPALRLHFSWETELVQIIDKVQPLLFQFHDLRNLTSMECKTEFEAILDADRVQAFDLECGPLFRVYLIQQGSTRFTTIFTHHHSVLDGWSLHILYSRLHSNYLTLASGAHRQQDSTPSKDYLNNQVYLKSRSGTIIPEDGNLDKVYLTAQAYLQSHYTVHLSWWKSYLSKMDERCVLHGLLKKTKEKRSQRSESAELSLSAQLIRNLKIAAASTGVTLNVIFLYVWHKVLSVFGSCSQTVVGTIVSGRNLPVDGIEASVGCYINTLPIIFNHKNTTIAHELKVIQEDILEVTAKHVVLLSDLVKLAALGEGERLFDSIFVYENYPKGTEAELELDRQLSISSKVTHELQEYPLAVLVEENGDRFSCSLTYNAGLYDSVQLKRLVHAFENILSSIAANPAGNMCDLHYVDDADAALLAQWAGRRVSFPEDILVQDLLEKWVKSCPEAIAVSTEVGPQSFETLWYRVNIVAEHLRQVVNFNTSQDVFIPFFLTEPHFLLETIFGILRAGGAYVPLDPTLTPARMVTILNQVKPQVIVSVSPLHGILDSIIAELTFQFKVIDLDLDVHSEHGIRLSTFGNKNSFKVLEACTNKRTSSDAVYMVFTSGSTGTPKGVVIEHKSLVNVILEMSKFMSQNNGTDVVLPLFGWGFDAIWSAIGVGMLSGGTTVLANPETLLDPKCIISFCNRNCVTQVHGNPLLVQQLPLEAVATLQTVCVAGQDISSSFVAQFRLRCPSVTLINGYGPTETTVGCILDKIEDDNISIGRCLGNVCAYVLDQFGIHVPIGVRGELFIGGIGVGRGYFQNEKTNQLFIKNPFGEGRLYRTGDIVYWTDGGKLVYVGREDFQVKVRGYRVDFSEIESAVESYPGIQKSVILKSAEGEGGVKLFCYAMTNVEVSSVQLLAYLERILPQYMIPAGIHFLSKLPLTSNGKLDTARLPKIHALQTAVRKPPRTHLESTICDIWASVLGLNVEQLGISDNFFQLGGDSVSSIQIVGRLRSQLGSSFPLTVSDVLTHKTIEALVENVKYCPEDDVLLTASNARPLNRGVENGRWICAANSLQEGLVYHYKSKGRHADAYVVQKVICYGVVIDLPKMRHSWELAYQSHPGLRVKFSWTDRIVQIIHQEIEPLDWREITVFTKSEFDDVVTKDRSEGFDLEGGNLIRITFVQICGKHKCVLTVHHAVNDGWSTGILLEFVHSRYYALVNQCTLPATLPDMSYMAGQQYLEATQNEHLVFWQSLLNTVEGRADWSSLLPATYDMPPQSEGLTVRTEKIDLPADLVYEVRRVATACDVTPNALFQLAWHRALRVFGHTEQTVVGTTVSGRNIPVDGIERSVGLFVNTLPLVINHTELDGMTGIQALQQVQEKTILLNTKSSVKLNKLKSIQFDSIYAFENYPTSPQNEKFEQLFKVTYSEGISYEDYPLLLTVTLKGQKCSLELQSSSRFLESATSRLLSTVYQLIRNILNTVENRMDCCSYLGQSEIKQIVDTNTLTLPIYKHTVLDYFRQNVLQYPNTIAIVYNDVTITYAELDKLSGLVCQQLVRNSSEFVGRDRLVPIFLDKGQWAQVGILGIMKSGSAYVPIDPVFPVQRIRNILNDISAHIVVTSSVHAQTFPDLKHVLVDILLSKTDLEPEICCEDPLPQNLAYAIYTSGTSTGKPKGCLIEHRNLVNYLEGTSERLFGGVRGQGQNQGQRPHEVLLQLASTTFDPSVDQIFLALYNGYTSVVPAVDLWMDRQAFVAYCAKNRVTNIFGTPSMLKLFNLSQIPTLRSVRVAGEKISLEAYNKIKGDGTYEVANVFGPTETTVVCTFKKMDFFTYSVGHPISNVSFYVVDPSGKQFVPIGAIGELYIGGAGVGRGYLNQHALNDQLFVPNPWCHGDRIYRSGDLVRRLPGGEVEFIGRNDGQVKVHGFRIELGEIQTRLLSFPGVVEGVVAPKEHNGSLHIIAYYVSDEELSFSKLSDHMAQALPSYMVPSAFVRLSRIPLTNNGKLDMNALPLPILSSDFGSNFQEPESEIERQVIQIWATVLGVEILKISTTENFFRLGGDSISALLIAEKLRLKFGSTCSATVNDIITLKTVKALASNCFHSNHPTTADGKTMANNSIHGNGDVSRELTRSFPYSKFLEDEKVEWVGRATSLQEGFVSQYLGRDEGDDSYAVQVLWKYETEMDRHAIRCAWETAYSNFPGLRVRFDWSSEVVQIVDKGNYSVFDWREQNWEKFSPEAQNLKLIELRTSDRLEYFDLAKGNLLRVYFINCAQNVSFCLLSNHHAILDGWSSSILFSVVHQMYLKLTHSGVNFEILKSKNTAHGIFPENSDCDSDFSDSSFFLAQEQIQHESERQTEFFKEILTAVDEQADFLSLTRVSAEALNLKNLNENILNLSNMLPQLNSLSVKYGFTTNTLLQFAWHQVLRIFLRMRKTVVGTTVSGRSIAIPGVAQSVGLFINTLPLVLNHAQLDSMSLVDALKFVQCAIFELNSNSAARVRSLQKLVNVGRMFDSLFVYENFPEDGVFDWENLLGVKEIQVFEKLDFPLVATVRANGKESLQVTVLGSDSFESSRLESLLQAFEYVLTSVVEIINSNPKALCTAISYCPNHTLEVATFEKCAPPEHSPTLIDLFKSSVARNPHEVAVITENQTYTYHELDVISDALATEILKIGGKCVGPDKFVALLLAKSEYTVIGILGVLKTGSAYVPIDPTYPDVRVRQILQDCAATVLVTNRKNATASNLAPSVTQIFIESVCQRKTEFSKLELARTGTNLAYAIYTSGTSGGAPKGCLIEHHSVVNLVESLSSKYYGAKFQKLTVDPKRSMTSEVVLQLSNYVYDLSVLQIWLALLNGSKILLPSEELVQNPEDLIDFMTQHGVTHVSGTPSFLKLINWSMVPSLKRLVIGGELLTLEAWQEISKHKNSNPFQIINEYGPTETTVTSSFLVMDEYSKSIGSPIANTNFYIMDENLRLLPEGVVGELLIGGRGLAREYLNRPNLNAKKFVFVNGHRLYRSGDLARCVSENSFEIMGRNDGQVKVRGQRIELQEIQQALIELKGITDAIAVVKDEKLVAYYVSTEQICSAHLRQELMQKLPSFCVPTAFVRLDKIPLAITGKVDVGAFPIPKYFGAKVQNLPLTKIEKEIAQIWAEILNLTVAQIGVDVDFVSLGGDSLLLMQMIQRIRRLTGVKVRVSEIFREKTIWKLIQAIEFGAQPSVNAPAQHGASFRLEDYPDFDLFEEIEGMGDRVFLFPPGLGGVGSYMDNIVPFLFPHPLVLFNNFYEFLKSRYGLRIPYGIAAREYLTCIKELQPTGHYYFVGWSWGGVLAYEIANQMAGEGSVVGTVFIIDSLFCMRKALSPADADRLKREDDISYHHDPPVTPALGLVDFVLFKATQVYNGGTNLNDEDNALDNRIYSYYVHKTKANFLDLVLPPETRLEVVPIETNHFQWCENKQAVELIGSVIAKKLKKKK